MSAPLCINCVHAGHVWKVRSEVRCTRDPAPPTDLVHGEPIYPTCESERASADLCGPSGRYFEPKETP